MPVVKTEKIYVCGVPFSRTVKCDSDGHFSCKLPDFISNALGVDERFQIYNSLSACIAAFDEFVDKYKTLTTVTTKVICFSIRNKSISSSGIMLQVAAGVFIEKRMTTAGQAQRFTYESVKSNLPQALSHDFSLRNQHTEFPHRILWTEEAERFFIDLGVAMLTLSEKLKSLADNPQDLQRSIEKCVHLLMSELSDNKLSRESKPETHVYSQEEIE